jgi:DNA repair protein RadC
METTTKYEVISERRTAKVRITKPKDLVPLLKRYTRRPQEVFLVITLDGASHVIKVHLVTIGLVNRTLIHPREVFIRAIKDNSCSVIIAHTHPSDQLEPSTEDKATTKRLREAGHLLGIEVLDHLILGKSGHFSFAKEGLLPH